MAFRKRWALYAVLMVFPVIGAIAGSVAAGSKPPVYTAEAKLSMGRADGGDAQVQVSNYARYLTPEVVMSKLPAGAVLDVSASPIPESNVIRVEAKAVDSVNAVEAAKVGARMLQLKVAALAGTTKAEATLAEYQKVSRLVATYQSKVNSSGGTGPDYVEAATQLSSYQAQQGTLGAQYQDQAKTAANSTLTLLAPAVATGDNARSREQIYLLAGFGGGALLAYVIARILGDVLQLGRPQPGLEPAPRDRETPRDQGTPPRPGLQVRPVDRLAVFDPPDDEIVLPRVPLQPPAGFERPAPAAVPAVDAAGAVDGPDDVGAVDRVDGARPGPATRSQPTITLRAQAQPVTSSRRGLTGLREEPTTQRSWS